MSEAEGDAAGPVLRLGEAEVRQVIAGRFRLDGGAMFGLVPRPLWEPLVRPDARHRVPLACNCLLVREPGSVTLVDAGLGSRFTERQRDIFALEDRVSLRAGLAAAGIGCEAVTRVVFTHLHFDHFCGALEEAEGGLRPLFPHAVHCVQEGEWSDAVNGRSVMRWTYRAEELRFLDEHVAVERLRGDAELTPHLAVRVTGGHTEHHQAVHVCGTGQTLVYPGDIMPTRLHARPYWGTAYDMLPYQTLESKRLLLDRAVDEGWTVAWNHDPTRRFSRLLRDGEQGDPVPVDVEA